MTTEEILVRSNLAIHRGESLAEEIEFRGISADQLAAQPDLSTQLLDRILRGEKPIATTVAHTLAATLETPAEFWINLQTKYDLTVSRNCSSANASDDVQSRNADPHLHADLLRSPGSEWSE